MGCSVSFSPLAKENVTECVVVSTRMVMAEIDIHPPRWGGLLWMVRAFLHGPTGTYLDRQSICILASERVNVPSSPGMLQSSFHADLRADFHPRSGIKGLTRA